MHAAAVTLTDIHGVGNGAHRSAGCGAGDRAESAGNRLRHQKTLRIRFPCSFLGNCAPKDTFKSLHFVTGGASLHSHGAGQYVHRSNETCGAASVDGPGISASILISVALNCRTAFSCRSIFHEITHAGPGHIFTGSGLTRSVPIRSAQTICMRRAVSRRPGPGTGATAHAWTEDATGGTRSRARQQGPVS